MRFKVGDKVRVREWDDMEKEFGINADGDIETTSLPFYREMKMYCGSTLTVCEVGGNFYKTDESKYLFSDDVVYYADFTKDDLEEMMICELRGGERLFWIDGMLKGITEYCPDVDGRLMNKNGYTACDIVKVYSRSGKYTLKDMLENPGPIIWERKQKTISSDEALRVLKEHYGCDVKISE